MQGIRLPESRRTRCCVVLALSSLLFAATGAWAIDLDQQWRQDLKVADELYSQHYYTTAIQDYQKIVASYPQIDEAVDFGWLGMGRCYQALEDFDSAKSCYEQVLERKKTPEAVKQAHGLYKALYDEARIGLEAAARELDYFSRRYEYCPWYNFIYKFFFYLDYREAQKNYDKAKERAESFDPHYLIDYIPVAQQGDSDASETPVTSTPTVAQEDTASSSTNSTNGGGSASSEVAPASKGETSPGTEPEGGQAIDELKRKADEYNRTYRAYVEALRSGDRLRIKEANEAFQRAAEAYKEARRRAAER